MKYALCVPTADGCRRTRSQTHSQIMQLTGEITVTIRDLLLNGLVNYLLTGGKTASVSGPALILSYIAGFIAVLVVPYLLGSINFGVLISGRLYGDDVRRHGSGNAGTTNMMRNYGTKAAVMTLAGDVLKAVAAVFFGRLVLGDMPLAGGTLAALMCVVGHAFPVFYSFRGGKGIAVTAGAVLALNWKIFLVLLAVFILTVLATRYISLGSVTCVFLWPLVQRGFNRLYGIENLTLEPVFTIMITVLVIFLHRENLKRLQKGTENKFSFKKSVPAAAAANDADEDAAVQEDIEGSANEVNDASNEKGGASGKKGGGSDKKNGARKKGGKK